MMMKSAFGRMTLALVLSALLLPGCAMFDEPGATTGTGTDIEPAAPPSAPEIADNTGSSGSNTDGPATNTTTALPPTPATPAFVVNPDSYVLGNGDTISILVFDEQDLTMDAIVGESGDINYSYLGAIRVAGKTPEQIEREITTALQDGYLVNPSVNVTIKQYRPFFINGEVRSPGGYPYQPGLTLDKAIALAGGLTDRASRNKMFVMRAGNSDGKKERVNLSAPIAPGDVVEINEGFF